MQSNYSPDQYRYIAGFLLVYRAGVLQALESVSDPAASQIPAWQNPQVRYYQDAESFTRYLLWQCGYPVGKNQNYEGDTWRGEYKLSWPPGPSETPVG